MQDRCLSKIASSAVEFRLVSFWGKYSNAIPHMRVCYFFTHFLGVNCDWGFFHYFSFVLCYWHAINLLICSNFDRFVVFGFQLGWRCRFARWTATNSYYGPRHILSEWRDWKSEYQFESIIVARFGCIGSIEIGKRFGNVRLVACVRYNARHSRRNKYHCESRSILRRK